MDKIASFIVKHKKAILVIFVLFSIVSIALQFFVKVNYNMTDYLPDDAQSTEAITLMGNEFTQAMPNANVMIQDVSVMDALNYKQELASIQGVEQVMWLDDVIDLKKPLEINDPDTVKGFYKNGKALYSVTISKGMEQETIAAIQAKIGPDNAVSGEASDTAFLQNSAVTEVLRAFAILLPVILLILILSSNSWIEPLLFLSTIGVSILINMGTNVIFGEISFMTNSVSPILQLAVSLDYAIFLLHSFSANREKYGDAETAMHHAIRNSISTVAASAMTTLFGFLALLFMEFRIGADLGMNLAKGILLSFISSMLFLPALTLCIYKWIDKTRHRPFLPSFKNMNKVLSKLAIPIVIAVVVMAVPCFLGQSHSTFLYGNESVDLSSRMGRDNALIKENFGTSNVMALLLPRTDVTKEKSLCDDLNQIEHVTSVMSYASAVGAVIPPEYVGADVSSQFYSNHYARVLVYTDTPQEGGAAFETVEKVQSKLREYYGDTAYSLGQSVNLYDMKNVVQKDNTVVNLIAVIAIFLVLLATFQSLTLPFILLLTIEAGIWINLSIPYFTGTSINYIGYLVINTVQLGATVDYAILLTTHYLRNRQTLPRSAAVHDAVGVSFKSILVSGATLSTAGFTLYATSTNVVISDLGLLLGRGTLLSMLMVVCFLPALLRGLDRFIVKTTKGGYL